MKIKQLVPILFILGVLSTAVQAQNLESYPKRISVQGSAEMEVTPDEIYFRITLKEYKPSNNYIVTIAKLENELAKAVRRAGIDDEDFQVENIAGYNWNYKKKKNQDFLASKTFILKLSDLNNVNDILGQVDAKGIQSVNVASYSHSRIEAFERDLRIQALQAAREKAAYLLASIDEELGEVITVNESGGNIPRPMTFTPQNNAMEMAMLDAEPLQIDFKKITLRYSMNATFAIK